MYTGATSSYSGGRGSLTATPWQRDTGIDDVRKFSGFGTASSQQSALAPRSTPTPRPSMPEERSGIDEKLKQVALRQAKAGADVAEAKARAMRMAAPTKELHGFNMAGRIMDDPENLTGAQREVFLPNESKMVSIPGDSSASLSGGTPDKVVPQGGEGDGSGGSSFERGRLESARARSDAEWSARQQMSALRPQGQPISYSPR